MFLRRLTVRARLAAGFAVVSSLVFAVTALSLRALGSSHEDYASYVSEDSARVTLANDILAAANARAIGARNLLLVSQPADRDAESTAVAKAHEKVQARVARLKEAVMTSPGTTARERQLFAALEQVETTYGPVALGITRLATEGRRDEAVARMNRECRPLLAALIKAADAYIADTQARAADEVRQAEAHYASSRNLLLAACGMAAALAVGLALLITRGITRALGAEPAELGRAAQQVAGGDLSPVSGAAHAPPGSVLASLGAMQSSLAQVVGRVRAASDSIATGSAQIAIGNADLSQRTEEQASNLQQTAASMEQMNATVQNNAGSARQATELAGAASAVAEQGGAVVGRVVATMTEISASSKRIADIIGVIDGIAFQTNILALNAAVEAARAGEQGRGFAVVASEVRSLAQRSAEAAREIKTLIGDSVGKVDAGTRLVNDAGTTMTEVVAQVRRVAGLIGEISGATQEQTTGIGQVSHAVSQLDQVTQQNAALVEESAAAAESLKHQAATLAELVSVFKLGQPA